MDYIQGLAAQTEIFLHALGFGFLLGIIYGVFRLLRMISDSKGFVIFSDLLYFAVCTFLAFCFILVTDSGNLRIYVMFGIVLGWTVCYFSFGAIFAKTSKSIIRMLKDVFGVVLRPFERLYKSFLQKMRKNTEFCKKNVRKSDKKVKFNLQKYIGIVYNLLGYKEK